MEFVGVEFKGSLGFFLQLAIVAWNVYIIIVENWKSTVGIRTSLPEILDEKCLVESFDQNKKLENIEPKEGKINNDVLCLHSNRT